MTPTETTAILRQFNEWRRSEDETVEQPDPREIGLAIDAAVELVEQFEDAKALAERYNKAAEIYAAERDHANQRYSSAVRLLTGIHALLYPPRFTDHDGRTWQFKSPLAEEQMQELSDRIRALPDEIARTALEKSK